jgi:isopenicillin N synthase-like dioxygenase
MTALRAATPAALPVVDVAALAGPDRDARRRVAREIRRIYETLGFLYIAGHGVPQARIDAVFAASREFHALPPEAKARLRINAAHRGYMGMATSTIVTSSVAKVTKPNMSESLMVMHELAPDDPDLLAGKPLQGPNQWPAELPAFRATVLAYVADLEALARRLTEAIALAFDLDEGWFAPHFRRPTTWLRLLHYPPLPDPLPPELYGAAPHTDYGFLTILAQDETGGLEVRARDGGWIAAPPLPGTFVVNVADMLMRWSNGLLLSTPHRVRNVSGRDRYSVPFFYDPGMDTVCAALPGTVKPGDAPRWPPVRFGDYVMERLDKNYAYRQGATAG